MTSTKRVIDLTAVESDGPGGPRPRQDERDLIAAIGTALFGARYYRQLARAIDVDERTLLRIMAAEYRRDGDAWHLGPDAWARLLALASGSQEQLDLIGRAARMQRVAAGRVPAG